ncbi:hypothetical protein CCP3SC15_1210013 [Gammaproteobacteria bacterium]
MSTPVSGAHALVPVVFQDATLFLVEHEGQPYVPMRPVVEGMGMSWQVQHRKLIDRFGSTITEMVTVAEDGKQRSMTCLPLRKLPGWLYTIHPNKVPLSIRPKVIAYQNECDDVLWRHWSGQRQTPAAPPPPLTAPAKFVVSVDANGIITTSPMPEMAPEGFALVDRHLLERIAAGATSLFYMHQVGMGIVYDLERAAGCDLYNHDQDTPLTLACGARGAK